MKQFLKERHAKDFMTHPVLVLQPQTSVRKIYELFLEKKIMGAPVVNQENEVLGMVTESDLAIREETIPVPSSVNFLGAVIYFDDVGEFYELMRKKLGQEARNIMTQPALTLEENASLEEILEFMDEHKINRVPIVNKGKKSTGIITRTDILKEIMREGKAV